VSTTFTPEGRRGGGGGGLAGLAAQLGAAGLVSDGGQSPAFYLDLLRSPAVLGRVVDATYADSAGRRRTYVQINRIGGRSPAEQRVNALEDLGKRLGTSLSPKTGVLKATVVTTSPALSRELADTLVASLNEFNLMRRQSQAGAERRFVERRLAEARTELRLAEERMENFLSRNRVYQNSPELMMQRERLDRDVMLRQGVLTTLAQSFEQARIDEVRDTPVITVIEAPETPGVPDRRKPFAPLALAVVIGGALGVAGAVALDRRGARRATRATAGVRADYARAAGEELR
jgi:uncharacterized protein involved in exopolysaccharide biosynthesis